MVTTAIEIIYNTQIVTRVKDQSENMVDNSPPERFYDYYSHRNNS